VVRVPVGFVEKILFNKNGTAGEKTVPFLLYFEIEQMFLLSFRLSQLNLSLFVINLFLHWKPFCHYKPCGE